MKIVSADIYCLMIPFVESFRHALSERNHSDSIVVKLTTDTGVTGFGEAVPRPYVTGETRDGCVRHIVENLLPGIMGMTLDDIGHDTALTDINKHIPETHTDGTVIWNAARCAVELALIDCFFRSRQQSINAILPPATQGVTYSGVISAGSRAKVQKMAERCKAAGFKYIKMKVSDSQNAESVAMVRDILGPAVSLRLDANAAFTPDTAIPFMQSVAPYHIACVEQPIPRDCINDLAAIHQASPIPIMADESIVTIDDAEALIAANAVDSFNLRISKCGGLHQTLTIAQLAHASGIGLQIGCQVGETAILSAAGRHLAATLPNVCFVEGSYSTYLLEDDISHEPIIFGNGGKAPLLSGPGLGITVDEDSLSTYSTKIESLAKSGP